MAIIENQLTKEQDDATYSPSGPCLVRSGEYDGKSYEELMFINYPQVLWVLDQQIKRDIGCREKGRVHNHLKQLVANSETIRTKKVCPYCGKNLVKLFLLDSSGHVETCMCESVECKLKANPAGLTSVYNFKFSTLKGFGRPTPKEIKKVFLAAYGIEKLNADKAFKLFFP